RSDLLATSASASALRAPQCHGNQCVLASRAGFADIGHHFLRDCLAAGARIDDAVLHHRADLLLVLSADPKAVRSLRLVLDLLLKPCLVSRLVLLPHLPLAGVVGE